MHNSAELHKFNKTERDQINKGNTDVYEKNQSTAEKTVAGNWSWHKAVLGHKYRNIGEVEVELVEIEVK